MPAAKVGREWRFSRRQLIAWIEEGGILSEDLVDQGLAIAVDEAVEDVKAGREKLVSWEEAKAALGL